MSQPWFMVIPHKLFFSDNKTVLNMLCILLPSNKEDCLRNTVELIIILKD